MARVRDTQREQAVVVDFVLRLDGCDLRGHHGRFRRRRSAEPLARGLSDPVVNH